MPTLADLRTAAKRQIDRINSKTPSDAEWNEWINGSAAELWDEIVTVYEDQFTTYLVTADPKASVFNVSNISALVDAIVLPGEDPIRLFKLRELEYSLNGEWYPLPSIPKQEWYKYTTPIASDQPLGYTLLGDEIHVLPSSTSAQVYRLFYIPSFVQMYDDADEFVVPNRWWEYVIVDACIKARSKFQEDASLEMARKSSILSRIKRAASNRTPGASRRMVERATHREDY
jgi:hypothetical protein